MTFPHFVKPHFRVGALVPCLLLGAVLKDDAQDRARLLAYWDSTVKRRAENSRHWQRLLELRRELMQ
jgi:hypothetical protein